MAAKLLKNGTVITFDDHTLSVKVLREASVLIVDGAIQAIENEGHIATPEGCEVIDVTGKIVSPGFINTHVHSWQTAYRSIGPNVTLPHYFPWFSQSGVNAPHFTPDDIYVSALEGYMEGINGGTTSYLEHAHANWNSNVMQSALEAAVDSGTRTWWCHDIANRDDFGTQQQWNAFEKLAEQHKKGLVELGLAYDGLSWALPHELEHTKEMIKKHDLRAITVHHLGGPWPGGSSAPSAPHNLCEHKLHTAGVPIVVSHGSWLTKDDMSAMREHNVHVSLTPESEFHYGHGQITGSQIMDQASLGIDTAYTFSGDILTQARLWLQHTRHQHFVKVLDTGKLPKNTPMTVEQGFLLATRQGGLAMHRKDIGVLQVGSKADIVVFNGDSPNMLGWNDPVAAIMLHANVGDIEHVLIDGEFRKRDFKLVNTVVEWSELKKRFLATAQRIQTLAIKPPPVPEKMFGIGETVDVEVLSTIRS